MTCFSRPVEKPMRKKIRGISKGVDGRFKIPYEIMKDGCAVPLFCQVGKSSEMSEAYKIFMGCFGVDPWLLKVSVPGVFPCVIKENCAGSSTIDFGEGGELDGVVVNRCGCNCIRSLPDAHRLTLGLILVRKYENKFLAACGMARFFLSTLCFLPRRVVELDTGRDCKGNPKFTFGLFYSNKEGEISCFLVDVVEDGFGKGYRVINPFDNKADVLKMACIKCNYKASNESLEANDYRMMFELSCGKHAVCEGCCPYFFTDKPQVDDSSEYRYLSNSHHGYIFCHGCVNDIKAEVNVCTENPIVLGCPSPYSWFGDKAILTIDVHLLFFRMYWESISWIVGLYYSVRKASANVQEHLRLKKEEVHALIRCPTQGMAASWKKRGQVMKQIKALKQDNAIINLLCQELDRKRIHVMFALNGKVPFSEAFLNHNTAFFEAVLGRSYFYQLISRLRMVRNLGIDIPGQGCINGGTIPRRVTPLIPAGTIDPSLLHVEEEEEETEKGPEKEDNNRKTPEKEEDDEKQPAVQL